MDEVTPIDSQVRRKQRSRQSHTPSRASIVKREAAQNEKLVQAYALRLGGKQPSEIAELLGYENVNDVFRLLEERFEKDASFLTDQERKVVLGTELLRLDALLAAVWPSAMMGDPKSVDSAVRVVAAQAKLTGLEQVDPVVNKNLVLVMGEREDDYIAALKATQND